jgi:uncharacterized protein
MSLLSRRSNDAEIAAFERVCNRLAGFAAHLDWEWVDGYLAGLACGPVPPVLPDWLERMTGDAFDRAFADPADRAQALQALRARLAVLGDQLDPEATLDDPDALRLEPLMRSWDDATRAEVVRAERLAPDEAARLLTGGAWAEGFLQATADAASDPARAPLHALAADDEERAFHDEALSHLQALALPEGDPALATHLARRHDGRALTRDELIDHACLAVQDLRLWWTDRVPLPQTRRVAPTPGRNDPCPCGSGRKFKKCHGAAG